MYDSVTIKIAISQKDNEQLYLIGNDAKNEWFKCRVTNRNFLANKVYTSCVECERLRSKNKKEIVATAIIANGKVTNQMVHSQQCKAKTSQELEAEQIDRDMRQSISTGIEAPKILWRQV